MMLLANLLAIVVASALLGLLTGCASSLNGFKAASDQPKCSADTNGTPCTPLSNVYKASMVGGLPGQLGYVPGAAPVAPTPTGNGTLPLPTQQEASAALVQPTALRSPLDSGAPVHTAPKILRVWIAPWEDSMGVLNDQRLVYLTIDGGRWLLEHNQRAIMEQYAPTRLIQGGPAANLEAPNRAGGAPNAAVPGGQAQPGNPNGLPVRSMNSGLETLGIKNPSSFSAASPSGPAAGNAGVLK